MKGVVTIRLPAEIDDRLTALAGRTGRTKTYYAREAILAFIDDLEDECLASERREELDRRVSVEEPRKERCAED